ncbi:MAG: hypothetical protein AAB354_11515 [candidate division KSB1 bacterium]|mgnify:CR=1 FL=1
MKEHLDKDFGKFIEKHPDIIRVLTNDSSLPLEVQWNFLLYIFELNYFSLNETADGLSFQPTHEAARNLQKPVPPAEVLAGLMRSAYEANKAESMQTETPLGHERCFVEAATAIPLTITGKRKILFLCKQLEMAKVETAQNYIFNGYELQRIMSHIKNFVRADEQQNEIIANKKKINEQQKQIVRNNKKIILGKLVAIGSGVFGSLQAWQATKDLFGSFRLIEIIKGLGMIAFLIFAVVVAIRLSQSDDAH